MPACGPTAAASGAALPWETSSRLPASSKKAPPCAAASGTSCQDCAGGPGDSLPEQILSDVADSHSGYSPILPAEVSRPGHPSLPRRSRKPTRASPGQARPPYCIGNNDGPKTGIFFLDADSMAHVNFMGTVAVDMGSSMVWNCMPRASLPRPSRRSGAARTRLPCSGPAFLRGPGHMHRSPAAPFPAAFSDRAIQARQLPACRAYAGNSWRLPHTHQNRADGAYPSALSSCTRPCSCSPCRRR